MVKAGEIINYTLLGLGGYIVYRNWEPLSKITKSILTGADAIIGGSEKVLEGGGAIINKSLIDRANQKSTTRKVLDPLNIYSPVIDALLPNNASTTPLQSGINACKLNGWSTPEEIARCVNLNYVQRGIKKDTTAREFTPNSTKNTSKNRVKSRLSSSRTKTSMPKQKATTTRRTITKKPQIKSLSSIKPSVAKHRKAIFGK